MQVTAINKEVDLVGGVKSWLKAAYNTYKVAKFQFIFFSIISTVIGAIPIIGAFMLPIFTAKYAEIASKIENNEESSFSEFFIGLFSHMSIIMIGVFHIIAYIIAFTLKFILNKHQAPATLGGDIIEIIFTIIAIFAIIIFILAFWLSPIICLKNHDVKAFSALSLSLKAFFSHIGKILKFGLLVMITGTLIIGALFGMAIFLQHEGAKVFSFIPGVLGVLFIIVWIPVLHLSAYFIYKSIFLTYNE